MTRIGLLLFYGFIAGGASVDVGAEAHHKLLLENARIRVWSVELAPGVATNVHYHKGFYGVLSLGAARISNEVPGRNAVVSEFDPGEVHTSKGGFDLVERNVGPTTTGLIVFEPKVQDETPFAEAMGNFPHTGALYAELFDKPGVRGYGIQLAPGRQVETHVENDDRLLIAVTSAQLEDVTEQGPVAIDLRAGGVRWFGDRGKHSIVNVGTDPCKFAVIELSQPSK